MATANVYSVENPPELEYIINNQGGKDIRCLNYVFRLKTTGKRSWNFLCTGKNCCASLSLKAFAFCEKSKVEEPFVIERLNLKHKDTCLPKEDGYFVRNRFLQDVKEKVKENPLVPTQQLYENQRAEERTQSEDTLPDYFDVKNRFIRLRSKNSKTNASSLSDVVRRIFVGLLTLKWTKQ